MEKVAYHSGTLIWVIPCRLYNGNEANQHVVNFRNCCKLLVFATSLHCHSLGQNEWILCEKRLICDLIISIFQEYINEKEIILFIFV